MGIGLIENECDVNFVAFLCDLGVDADGSVREDCGLRPSHCCHSYVAEHNALQSAEVLALVGLTVSGVVKVPDPTW